MDNPSVLITLAAITLIAGLLQAQEALERHRPAAERWWMITGAVAVVMLFFALASGPQFGFIGYPMSVLATPLLTIVLGVRWPLPWGCAASAVTVLHGASWLGSQIAEVAYAERDVKVMASVYVLNVLYVAGVAVVRLGKRQS